MEYRTGRVQNGFDVTGRYPAVVTSFIAVVPALSRIRHLEREQPKRAAVAVELTYTPSSTDIESIGSTL